MSTDLAHHRGNISKRACGNQCANCTLIQSELRCNQFCCRYLHIMIYPELFMALGIIAERERDFSNAVHFFGKAIEWSDQLGVSKHEIGLMISERLSPLLRADPGRGRLPPGRVARTAGRGSTSPGPASRLPGQPESGSGTGRA